MTVVSTLEEPTLESSDESLVGAARSGDRDAFAALYDRYARLVRAVCYDRVRDSHTAGDLTQEVFLRAFLRLATLNDPARFSAWLVGMARRVCQEWRRNRSRRPCATEASDEIVAPAGDADDLLSERQARLRESIATLPERERLALHAFYSQGLDVEQLRGLLGLSRTGVYLVLANARRRLEAMLREQEVRP